MKVSKQVYKNGKSRVYLDDVRMGGAFVGNGFYIDIDCSGSPILGSGTFKGGSDSEAKLIRIAGLQK